MTAASYFDLSPTDRSLAILDDTSPVTFHAVWDLIGAVDFDALAWAWQALALLHPILTCQTNLAMDSVWRPGPALPGIHMKSGGADIDQATSQELAAHLSLSEGPIVRLTSVTRADGCRMILAAHHAAFDGAASVELIDDLRRIYLGGCADRPGPSAPDLSPRTLKAAMRRHRVPVVTGQRVITQSLDRWRKLPTSDHVDPSPGATQIANAYVTFDLGPALDSLAEQRRHNSWPMDAVLVALLERAWNEVFGSKAEGAGVWLVSANLRASLGLEGGIGNLGGVEAVAMTQGEKSLDRVIEEAAAEIAVVRSDFPGLGPELMAKAWAWMPPSVLNRGVEAMIRVGKRRRYTRILSNLGRIPDSLMDWGQVRLQGLRYLGPMAKGPYCLFVAMSHAGSSSLTMRTSPGWFTAEHARQLETAINRSCGLT